MDDQNRAGLVSLYVFGINLVYVQIEKIDASPGILGILMATVWPLCCVQVEFQNQ